MNHLPTVTACLIVKNEAARLGRCLASLQGWVDEIVVVDTGSTDETVAIAESFGAKVGHFAWCDDFSAARNASLDLATSDWVLVIDADEALDTSAEDWRAVLTHQAGAWLLMQAHLDEAGRVGSETKAMRLFRRHPEVRFAGRIHETVLASVEGLGWAIGEALAIRFMHTGYQQAAIAESAKGERNTRLAEREVADRPQDPMAWLNLARSYAFDQKAEAAYEAFRHLRALTDEFDRLEPPMMAYAVQSAHEICQRVGRPAEAEAMLTRALERLPGCPEFLFERGRLRASQGDAPGARADFEACLAAHGRAFPIPIRPGLTDASPRQALAALGAPGPAPAPENRLEAAAQALGRADWPAAKALLLAHLEASPRSAAAFRGLATAMLGLDQPEKALVAIGQALALDGGNAAGYALLGTILEALGQPGYAERAYGVAVRLDPDRHEAIERRLACRRQPPVPPLPADQATLIEQLVTPRVPTLSACLIVKNEAANLPRCLASLQDWMDEIVVVDTGSTDETVAIAESFGAKLGRFAWCDDFAAARNASLDLATSDWILIIDADEEFVVDDPERFRRSLARFENAGFNLPLANLSEAGEVESSTPVMRLFRRCDELRFDGRLHETVDIRLARLGWTVEGMDSARFLHHGYTLSAIVERKKGERNVAIAEADVRDRPDDATAWLSLGRSLQLAGRHDEAMAAYDHLAHLPGMPEGLPIALFSVYISCRAFLHQASEQWREAEATLTLGLRLLDRFPEFHFERARMRAHLGDIEGARADLEACLKPLDRPYPLPIRAGLTDELPRQALASLLPVQTSVTACLIVKNEAANLRRCLQSLRGRVNEIVVVDTGSTDTTVAIAESFGARVGHFAWCDDFSAARNASLDLATSDWVLVIDADEELIVTDDGAWRALMASARDGAAFVPIKNLTAEGLVETVSPSLRLFRRHEAVRFVNRLHEDVAPSLHALGWSTAVGRGLEIHHHGYTDQAIAATGKLDRNYRLARQMVDDQPGDAVAWHQLARMAWRLRRADEALDALARVRALADQGQSLDIGRLPLFLQLEATVLAETGRPAEAIASLNEGLAVCPGFPEYHYERGRLRAEAGDVEGAIADFEACLRAHGAPQPVVMRQGVTGYLAHAELVMLEIQRGRTDEAARHARLAGEDPACPRAERANFQTLAEQLSAMASPAAAEDPTLALTQAIEAGDWPRAKALALDALDRDARSADAFQGLALACLSLGELDKALLAVGQAIGLDAAQPAGYYLLGLVLSTLEQPTYAERAFATVLQLDPEHPNALEHRLACRRQAPAAPLPAGEAAAIDRLLGLVRPTVSACLIVKNEAAKLRRCLASLRGWVDEVVVVDTGSTDETVAIAESFGAKVGHFAWCDDFSAARNASLEMATSDWVLVIDADETLVMDDPEAFTRLLRLRRVGGYCPRVVNIEDDGRVQSEFPALRLFQRHEAVRFRGPVHETVGPALEALGWPVTEAAACHLRHDGYAASVAADKQARNTALAEQFVKAEPDNPRAWLQLARVYGAADRHGEALAALDALDRTPAGPDSLPLDLWSHRITTRQLAYQALGRHREAEAVLDEGLARLSGYPGFLYERGRVRAFQANFAGARADFEACLAAHGQSFPLVTNPAWTDALPSEGLAAIARHTASTARPTLSACLIVKNEAANLARCLASLKPWVDEIVVVDTGSTDTTVAIAESFGAKVGHFTWCDDFAAARNASLALATSDWIVVVDADEELVVSDGAFFRRLLEDRKPAAYMLRQVNVLPNGAVESKVPVLRLFQRLDAIRFAGRIHENIGPSVATLGWPIYEVEAVHIRHGGYRPELLLEKGRRNARIAEQEVADHPEAAHCWVNLARSLQMIGEYPQALAAYERMMALPGGLNALEGDLWGNQILSMQGLYRELGRAGEAEAILTDALARMPGYPAFHYERGCVRVISGDPAGARADFKACLAAHGRHFPLAVHPDLTDALPRQALAALPMFVPPTVTACLIVKNEAANLRRCLRSLAGAVDEIVVVDTGSTDETVAIAESFGAKVGHFAWCDDFSAARNASLALATSDWVLVIDADEELILDDPKSWRAALAQPGTQAWILQVLNMQDDGSMPAHPLVRLFRRDPAVRYERRLHEDVSQAIARAGWRVGELSAAWLRHRGYLKSEVAAKDKWNRNFQLAIAEVEARPHDVVAWYQLGRTALFLAQEGASLEAFDQVARLLAAGARLDAARFETYRELYAGLLTEAGRTAEAEALRTAAV